jgi:4-amino-4-deoxy-L-arabinose transferase-like glycosyltransferase
MTINFQRGVLSSHKPNREAPVTHSNPLHQEKTLLELENLNPIFFIENTPKTRKIPLRQQGQQTNPKRGLQARSKSYPKIMQKNKNLKFKHVYKRKVQRLRLIYY